MLRLIALVDVGNLLNDRVIWVGVVEHVLDGVETLGDCEGG